jgi:hypothetical protein
MYTNYTPYNHYLVDIVVVGGVVVIHLFSYLW